LGFVALTGSATVVVVERDPAAQELIDQALRGSGHRVLITRDPQEALRVGRQVRIDVLVGDAELWREQGSLMDWLRSIQSEMRLVRVCDPDEQYLPDLDGEVGLRRPFSLDELEGAVAQALKRDSPVG
jgi:DNA-binding response OmpR family regulator